MREETETMSFWDYFRSPFPKATGFSPYRSPGMLVHLPVILFSALLGIWLCLGDVWLYPLFGLYLVVGIYLGRDIAILAHYNPFITLGVIGGGVLFITLGPQLNLPRPEPLISAAITGALGVVYAIYISWYVDLDTDQKEARPPTKVRFPVLQRLIDRIDHAATQDDDSEPVRLRKTLLIFLSVSGMLLAPWAARHLSMLLLPQAANAALGFAAISFVVLLLLLITRRETIAAWLQLLALLVTPAMIHWEMGGFSISGAIVLWSLLAPLCALVFFGTRWATLWFGAYGLLVLGVAVRDVGLGLDMGTVVLFTENILLVSTLAFIALRFFIVERDRIQGALEHEQARSEKLLLNILPAPIAARLKNEHQALADGYADVSVLFADIVGFTKMSATISPERLVDLLNRLFSRFDALCDRYGVEKIKTIGDAYMVCAGLPVQRPDHAHAVADMALAMQEALAEHNKEFGSELNIRIGINSGPVVAGVIGLKKFIYDLWGDTVNLASRMESNGLPGSIQVSASTREHLYKDFMLKSRGKLDIKGIGATEAYLLTGRITASST